MHVAHCRRNPTSLRMTVLFGAFGTKLKIADVFGKNLKIGNNVFHWKQLHNLCQAPLSETTGIIGAGSVVRGNFPENSL